MLSCGGEEGGGGSRKRAEMKKESWTMTVVVLRNLGDACRERTVN